MKPRKHLIVSMICLLATLLLGACSPTSVTGQWKDPTYQGPRLNKILTIAVAQQSQIRRNFEDQFDAQLAGHGVSGVASYNFIPQEEKVPMEQVVAAVKQSGAQAALVIRLVKAETKTTNYGNAGPQYYSSFGGFYDAAWSQPDTYQYPVYTLEAKLFDATDHKLIWTATLESVDPRSDDKGLASVAKTICDAIAKAGLI